MYVYRPVCIQLQEVVILELPDDPYYEGGYSQDSQDVGSQLDSQNAQL